MIDLLPDNLLEFIETITTPPVGYITAGIIGLGFILSFKMIVSSLKWMVFIVILGILLFIGLTFLFQEGTKEQDSETATFHIQ